MHFSTSLFATVLVGSVVVSAGPIDNCSLRQITIPESMRANSSNADMPLPPPTGTLAKILLGVGYQNYSCANGVPVPNGAMAVLYDSSCLAEPDLELIALAPAVALHTKESAQDMGIKVFQRLLNSQITAGVHLFQGDFATPVFKLSKDNTEFVGKAGGKVPALPSANRGKAPDANGAVPSLRLVPKDTTKPNHYTEVYRLWTAGGAATATCDWTGQKRIPYSAQYVFYV